MEGRPNGGRGHERHSAASWASSLSTCRYALGEGGMERSTSDTLENG